MEDLYQDLGISKTATAEEIKKAYRDAAFKYHPDRNPGNTTAEEKFKRINAAYSVLGDESKRSQYDRYGSASERPATYQNAKTQYGYDPFEELFRRSQNAETQRRSYTYTYYSNSSQKSKHNTKKDAVSQLIRSLISICLCVLFFPFALHFSILGLLVIISVIVNGVSGILRSLQYLFSIKEDK